MVGAIYWITHLQGEDQILVKLGRRNYIYIKLTKSPNITARASVKLKIFRSVDSQVKKTPH